VLLARSKQPFSDVSDEYGKAALRSLAAAKFQSAVPCNGEGRSTKERIVRQSGVAAFREPADAHQTRALRSAGVRTTALRPAGVRTTALRPAGVRTLARRKRPAANANNRNAEAAGPTIWSTILQPVRTVGMRTVGRGGPSQSTELESAGPETEEPGSRCAHFEQPEIGPAHCAPPESGPAHCAPPESRPAHCEPPARANLRKSTDALFFSQRWHPGLPTSGKTCDSWHGVPTFAPARSQRLACAGSA
jgi:hypothetical protein